MMNTPCLGTWDRTSHWKQAFLEWNQTPWGWHPTFKRRLSRILECPYFNSFHLWRLDCFKNNSHYYFVQITSVAVEVERFGKTGLEESFTFPPLCFYLGKYPVYWVRWPDRPGYAAEQAIEKRWAIGMKPFIAGVDMSLFEHLQPNRWEYYLSPEDIATYKAQIPWLKGRADWLFNCTNKTYAPTPTGTDPSGKPFTGYTPIPEVPISQLSLPAPTVPEPLSYSFPANYLILDIALDFSLDPAKAVFEIRPAEKKD